MPVQPCDRSCRPDPRPQHAALIALAVTFRCPRLLCELNDRAVAADGSYVCGPWGGVFAITPELRRFIATHHHSQPSRGDGRPRPFLPGTSYDRMSQRSIRRALAELDAPESLWHDPPGTHLGERADADGRALLHNLTIWRLWPQRKRPVAQTRAGPDHAARRRLATSRPAECDRPCRGMSRRRWLTTTTSRVARHRFGAR
jgi:hypothetical protein